DAMRDSFESAMSGAEGAMFSIQNGVTAAGGDTALDLLNEMRAGTELRIRSRTAAPAAGLVSASTYLTGRFENGTLVPFFLDESFARGLESCGLTE
ncbi:MAG: hypothetical protein VXW22_13585, partial [Pseudomonadota bacterium]|nr:hypothetical protein [Pseudomonadota bacterium]